MSSDQSPIVKKVSPYPIDLTVTQEGKVLTFKILKLTERGFIADTSGTILKVASTIHECSFVLPTTELSLTGSLRVIKNYDRPIMGEDKTRTIQRLTEFHFLKLSDEQRNEIRTFLVRIKQVKA